MIPFNKPFITGNETGYIEDALATGRVSGNGKYTRLCHSFFEQRYHIHKAFLTTSCTDALEMCALLLNIKPGDEVIIPAYSFVSTALAFMRQGAKIVFADCRADHPNIDENRIEPLITRNTRAIVVVHYAGIACQMDQIMEIASTHNLFVVEDAAPAMESYFTDENGTSKALGTIGHLGCFSFHDTKNIHCGEGGLLAINDERFAQRAEIIWEKGTNRASFFRGEVEKYDWVDLGSSFLPSEISAAFLWAQLEAMDGIQLKRHSIWNIYYQGLRQWADNQGVTLPNIPSYASHNAHLFYLICPSSRYRNELIRYLHDQGIYAVFHYQSLHLSRYYGDLHDGRKLAHTEKYSEQLLRLPLFHDLTNDQLSYILDILHQFDGHQRQLL